MEDQANGLFGRASARYRKTRLGTRIAVASLMSAAVVTAGGLTALNASGATTPTPSPSASGATPTPTPTPSVPTPGGPPPHHCKCRTPSTTVLSVSPLVQQRKSPVQLTANVSCASLPTGTVTFRRRDNTVLGTAKVTFPTALHTGVAELSVTTNLPIGKRFVDATYNGNSTCKPSTSALVMVRIVAKCGCMSTGPGTPGDVKVTG